MFQRVDDRALPRCACWGPGNNYLPDQFIESFEQFVVFLCALYLQWFGDFGEGGCRLGVNSESTLPLSERRRSLPKAAQCGFVTCMESLTASLHSCRVTESQVNVTFVCDAVSQRDAILYKFQTNDEVATSHIAVTEVSMWEWEPLGTLVFLIARTFNLLFYS